MVAAASLNDARDVLAQAVGYAALLDDTGAQKELTALLFQVAAILSIVSTYLPPDEEEEPET